MGYKHRCDYAPSACRLLCEINFKIAMGVWWVGSKRINYTA